MWICRPSTRSSLTPAGAGAGTESVSHGCSLGGRDRLILTLSKVRVIKDKESANLDGLNRDYPEPVSASVRSPTKRKPAMDIDMDMDIDYLELERTFEAMSTEEFLQAPIGRDKQYNMLMNALGQPQTPAEARFNIPCGLLLWGAPSSGKSHVVEDVLRVANIEHSAQASAFDMMEGARVFLDEILQQLTGTKAELKKHCENGMQFLEALSDLNLPAEDRVVIVVHNAELLRVNHEDILYVLLGAQEETGMKICTILCSKVPPVGYFTTGFMKHVPTVHFPLYTKDELAKIIHKEFTDLHGKQFFNEYLDAFVNVQTKNCRDVRKLLRMFESSYKTFLQNPQVKTAKSFREVWTITKTHIGSSFSSLSAGASTSNKPKSVSSTSENLISKNLPLHAKYLLVGAYLASQNPASTDKRFFVHSRVGTSKKPNIITTGVKRESENGAAVAHSRLVAIIAALMKQTCKSWEMTTGFLSIIPTLCNAGLIERIGNPLDECKYRSCTDFDLVVKLGQDIGIDVMKYLYRMI